MTPAQHKTEAENLLTLATNPGRTDHGEADFDVIAANAALAQASGGGTHYTAAEAALVKAAAAKNALGSHAGYMDAARVALAHAHLADR